MPGDEQQAHAAERMTMEQVDSLFEQLGVLGHGGQGSILLARKRSGRLVAIKTMRIGLDDDEDEVHSSWTREVESVLKLDCTTSDGNGASSSDMSIVWFRDWFRGPNFACIVMQYADGGTLATEIESRSLPYTERRISWYLLQLCEALSHAHSKGVYHHDVKASNVLIDATSGGRLLLADFGSALSRNEESRGFTRNYASPELLEASNRDNYEGLEQEKVDAFALGCILFELLCCKRLRDFDGEQTLGQFIWEKQSSEAALSLPDVRLPWLPQKADPPYLHTNDTAGYSFEIGYVVKQLLEPHPSNRATPNSLVNPLRQDERSPLMAHYCSAAIAPEPGSPVTVDNIQLGLFVQRGFDWNDGEADGGQGSVGVVVRLDPDSLYTEVAFPCSPKPLCCRIGAGRKFELQVGPTTLPDFVDRTTSTRARGNIYTPDTTKYHVGQSIHENCTVVGIDQSQHLVLVAPTQRIAIPTQPVARPDPVVTAPSVPRKPMAIPSTWNTDLGLFVPLETGDERQLVLDAFYSTDEGGMDIQRVEVVSIHAIQSQPMWEKYARCCEDIAMKNWANPNQRRLFHGTGRSTPEHLLRNPDTFFPSCSNVTGQAANEVLFSSTPRFADRFACRNGDGTLKQILLSRVLLGRIDDRCQANRPPSPPFPVEHHCVHKRSQQGDKVFSISNASQIYPEFIVTYKVLPRSGSGSGRRRTVRARRPQNSPSTTPTTRPAPARPRQTPSPSAAASSPSLPQPFASPPPAAAAVPADLETTPSGTATKMCVVCWERPVSTVNVPCGHASLCGVCATKQGLRKLNHKCPECRQKIQMAAKFYGKIVEDLLPT